MSSDRVNVVLFGLGRAGHFHLNNIARHPRVRVLYVIDSDQQRIDEVTKMYDCIGYTSAEVPLADPRVNAVIVATPTPVHYQNIMDSLRANKAVFSEKPVGYTLTEIDEVFAEAKKRNLPLLCGYNRRFDRNWIKAAEAVQRGDVGHPQIARSTARDSPVPTSAYLSTSHGFFHDSGVHDIDVIRWFLQEEPSEVFAVTHCYLDHIKALNDIDTVVMTFKFPSGCISTIDLSRKSVYGYDQRVEIFGDKGMVQVENRPTTTCVVSNERGEWHDNIQYSFPQRFEEAYYLELDHFARVLLDGEVPRISHSDCRNIYIIAEAARKSAETNRPVKIDYSVNE